MLSTLLRYFHTIRYLKVSQILWRLRYRFFPLKNVSKYLLTLRPSNGSWEYQASNHSSLISETEFHVLNQSIMVKDAKDWNNDAVSKLALYNIHYFDDLNSADAGTKLELHESILNRWIEENPLGAGNGWEPYPLSLRIVNWCKYFLNQNIKPSDSWRESLVLQVTSLEGQLEFHIQGNHLFANAKALTFAGCFFEGKQANIWLNRGSAILKRELGEQILGDGGHFELSPMYHGIILEDILDLINLSLTYPGRIDADLKDELMLSASKMLNWLTHMTHTNGEISFFNDAALGISKSLVQLTEYAKQLGIKPSIERSSYQEYTGYISKKIDNTKLIMDVAKVGPDYLPGHAHADSLSFELSHNQQRIFVNSGTSLYGTDNERQRQRSTKSHNTVVINAEDSSQVWGGFRVAKRAYVKIVSFSEDAETLLVKVNHNGYRWLKGKPVHNRELSFSNKGIRVCDSVEGEFKEAIAYYHLHPDIKVEPKSDELFALSSDNGLVAEVKITRGVASLNRGTYHPEFGISQPNNYLSVTLIGGKAEVDVKIIKQ